jgi:hypothetical protein
MSANPCKNPQKPLLRDIFCKTCGIDKVGSNPIAMTSDVVTCMLSRRSRGSHDFVSAMV